MKRHNDDDHDDGWAIPANKHTIRERARTHTHSYFSQRTSIATDTATSRGRFDLGIELMGAAGWGRREEWNTSERDEERGVERGTSKAGRMGGRLRHLAQACAPRVNTAGLALWTNLRSPSQTQFYLTLFCTIDKLLPAKSIPPLCSSPTVNRWSRFFFIINLD